MTDLERLSRRAFLRGLTVTSAGLLVPSATVFDMGRKQRAILIYPGPTPGTWYFTPKQLSCREIAERALLLRWERMPWRTWKG